MASREINAMGGSLRGLSGDADSTGRHVGLLGGAVSNLGVGIMLGVGVVAAQGFAQALGVIPGAVIGMNASLEKSTLQFETLFQDADRAREHVRMLFEFAKVTPFETQPIIDASRQLQTFGGDALNTQENLRMIGDAAAGASTDIGQVSFWVGRAYAAIQGGQPFGEARMRLQELALLTPTAAAEMERLQKSGASTTEVWQVLQGELGRFTGSMEKQAATWGGLTSTLSDTLNLTIADAFKPFFEIAKNGLTDMITLFSSPEFQNGLRDFANGAVAALKTVGDIIGSVLPYVIGMFKAVATVVGIVIGVIKGIIDFMVRFKTGVMIVGGIIGTFLIPILIMWAVAQLAALAPWLLLAAAIAVAIGVIIVVADVIGTLVGWLIDWVSSLYPVQVALDIVRGALEVVGSVIGWVIEQVKGVLDFFGLLGDESEETAGRVNRSMGKIDEDTAATASNIAGLGDHSAAGLREGMPKVDDAATAMGATIKDGIKDGQVAAVAIAKATPFEIAKSLRDGSNPVKVAAELLKDAIENSLTPAKEIAQIEGELSGSALAKALNDKRPEVRAAAVAWKAAMEERLFALRNGVPEIALATGTDYATALAGKQSEIGRATQTALLAAQRGFQKMQADASVWGENTGSNFSENVASGIRNSMYLVKSALAGMQKLLLAASPPGPESPLHRIDVWGERTGETFGQNLVHGIESTLSNLRGALGQIAVTMTPAAAPALAAVASRGDGADRAPVIQQTFYFGRDSVRSDDDIRQIGQMLQERAQLQGFAPTFREVGRVTV